MLFRSAAVADVGLAAMGSEYSSYGYAKRRQGFAAAGGTEEGDVSNHLEWGIRQLLGIGWNQVAFQNVTDLDEAHEIKGRLQKYVEDATSKMEKSLVNENTKALNILRDKDSTADQLAKADRDIRAAEQLKDLIASVKEKTLYELNRDYEALQENIKNHPGPRQKP